jgi:hypothetical protein
MDFWFLRRAWTSVLCRLRSWRRSHRLRLREEFSPKLRLLWAPVKYCPFLRANYIDFLWSLLRMEFFFLVQHHQYLGRDKSGGAGWSPFPGKCYLRLYLAREKFSFWYQDEDFSDLSDFSWEEGSSGETSSGETSSEDEDGEVEVVLQPHMRTRSSRGRRP